MRKYLLLLGAAVGLIGVAVYFLWPRQPEKPLDIRLTLAKHRIQANEWLWYLAEMKNVGRKPVKIDDPFWFRQSAILDAKQTRFEIIDPDGEPVPYNHHGYDQMYGVPKFWTNDCGGGKDCEELFAQTSWPTRVLGGGETMPATPSMIRPVRPRNRHMMDDPGDPRDLPEIPKGWSKEKVEAMRKKWKAMVEQSGYTMGDPTFWPDPKEPAVVRPQGYRALDLYNGMFDKIGKYRMRLVYVPDLGYGNTADEKARYARKTLGESLRTFLRRNGWPAQTRVFRFESNWQEFEVMPPPFPKHMFRHRHDESTKSRAMIEWSEREMRERFIWAEDSPAERARKELRDRQQYEQRKQKYEMLRSKAAELRRAK